MKWLFKKIYEKYFEERCFQLIKKNNKEVDKKIEDECGRIERKLGSLKDRDICFLKQDLSGVIDCFLLYIHIAEKERMEKSKQLLADLKNVDAILNNKPWNVRKEMASNEIADVFKRKESIGGGELNFFDCVERLRGIYNQRYR